MNWLSSRWESLPESTRFVGLLAAVLLAGLVATALLLQDSGVHAVLYQAF